MARDFSRAFYHSKQWKTTREAYINSVGRLCERCLSSGRLSVAEIVHHRVHLTPENISDPDVSLSFGNLEALCRRCHAMEHPEIYGEGDALERNAVFFDANGNVVRPPEIGGLDG